MTATAKTPASIDFVFDFVEIVLFRCLTTGGGEWFSNTCRIEGVVAPWCNPLTLQPEQSGGVGSSPGRAPPLERHDKGSRTRLGLLYFCDPSAWR